jgi:hypothetical protein
LFIVVCGGAMLVNFFVSGRSMSIRGSPIRGAYKIFMFGLNVALGVSDVT